MFPFGVVYDVSSSSSYCSTSCTSVFKWNQKGLTVFLLWSKKQRQRRRRRRSRKKQTSKRLPANNDGEFDLNENETFQHRITYAGQCPKTIYVVFLIQNHFDEHIGWTSETGRRRKQQQESNDGRQMLCQRERERENELRWKKVEIEWIHNRFLYTQLGIVICTHICVMFSCLFTTPAERTDRPNEPKLLSRNQSEGVQSLSVYQICASNRQAHWITHFLDAITRNLYDVVVFFSAQPTIANYFSVFSQSSLHRQRWSFYYYDGDADDDDCCYYFWNKRYTHSVDAGS